MDMNTTTSLQELTSNLISMDEFQWDGKSRSVYAGSFRFEKFSDNKRTGVKSWFDPRLKTRVKDVLIHKNNSEIYFAQTTDNRMLVYINGNVHTIPYMHDNPDFSDTTAVAWLVGFETSSEGDRAYENEYPIPVSKDYEWNMKDTLALERSMLMFYIDTEEITEDFCNAHWINPLTFERYESSKLVKYTMLAGHFARITETEDSIKKAELLYMPSDNPSENKWEEVPGNDPRPLKIYHFGRSKNVHARMVALYMARPDDRHVFDIYSPYTKNSVLDCGDFKVRYQKDDDVMLNAHPSAILDFTSITSGRTRVVPLIQFDKDGKPDKTFRVETLPEPEDEEVPSDVQRQFVYRRQEENPYMRKRESFIIRRILTRRKYDENMTIKELMEKLDQEIFESGSDRMFCGDFNEDYFLFG